jgi:hypothetical protein
VSVSAHATAHASGLGRSLLEGLVGHLGKAELEHVLVGQMDKTE